MKRARPAPWRVAAVAAVSCSLLAPAPAVLASVSEDRAVGEAEDSSADTRATIKRDTYGVPHIYADTTQDLFYGYGYAVAEDRLFQMEMAKRSVLGTTAEVLGEASLEHDRLTRSGFDPESIHRQIQALPQEDRDILEGYAEGFNQRIDDVLADRGNLLPQQFTDYGFEPSRWTGYDVAMIWIGTMANRFSDSTSEVANLQVRDRLVSEHGQDKGQELFDQILWTEDPTAPTTDPRTDHPRPEVPGEMPYDRPGRALGPQSTSAAPGAATGAAASSSLLPVDPSLSDDGLATMARNGGEDWPHQQPTASNLWAVGSKKSADGGSVLLNGPQFGWFNPSYVYGVGLHGAGFDVTGNTPFGYPMVLFGTNKDISWGATAGPLDVNDVYQEQLNPENPDQYWFDGAWRDREVRQETVQVKDGEDVVVEVRSTVHGFVTSVDEQNNTAYTKRRSWAGAEIESLLAWTKKTKATDWEEYLDQAQDVGISINWYYADNDGNIGYVSPGHMPDRPEGQDPRLPVVGDGTMEWEGIRPFEENPRAFNPKQGYIANWNNQPGPGAVGDSGNWSDVDRVNEITSRLQAQRKLSTEDMWAINEETSFADLNIRYLRPYLEEAVRTLPAHDPVAQDARLLLDWDGQTRDEDADGHYDGPEPAIMRAWVAALTEDVLQDDLPAEVYAKYAEGVYAKPGGSARPADSVKLIDNALQGEDAGVPQTVDLLNGRDGSEVVLESFAEALDQLRAEHGEDPANWRTETVPHVYSTKNFMGIDQAGDDEALSTPIYMNRGTENNIISLNGHHAEACMAAPPGQSGFIAPDGTKSPHYSDQLELYTNFECKQENLFPAQVEANLESVTTLR